MVNEIWKPPPEWGKIFADNLKFERLKKSISQKNLADALGVTGGAVAMWETDKSKPNLDTLIKICLFFGKSIDELLFENLNGGLGGRASPSASESPPGAKQKEEIEKEENIEARLKRIESALFQKQSGAAQITNL